MIRLMTSLGKHETARTQLPQIITGALGLGLSLNRFSPVFSLGIELSFSSLSLLLSTRNTVTANPSSTQTHSHKHGSKPKRKQDPLFTFNKKVPPPPPLLSVIIMINNSSSLPSSTNTNTSTTVPSSTNTTTNHSNIPLSLNRGGVEYRCGDCGAKNMIKGGDPVRCRQCGFRILYKTRTKRCQYMYSYIHFLSYPIRMEKHKFLWFCCCCCGFPMN